MTGATTVGAGLRRSFGLVSGTFVVALLAIAVGAAYVESGSTALRWLGPTGAVAGFELWFLRRHLDSNHPDGAAGNQFARLGAGNLVTLVRGGAFAAIAGFALLEPVGLVAWLPAALYATGSALDWIDGLLARWSGHTTVLGEKLDMAFDTLGFVVAPVVAVIWGRLPIWYLSLSAARYLFRAGKAARRRRGRPVYDLPESRVRRPLAGLQMAFIAFALAPILAPSTVHALAAVVLLPSLSVFARDYLVVAGHVNGGNNNN